MQERRTAAACRALGCGGAFGPHAAPVHRDRGRGLPAVSRSTVYRLIEDGSLHGTRIGQALRFTPDNIRELIALGSVDRGA